MCCCWPFAWLFADAWLEDPPVPPKAVPTHPAPLTEIEYISVPCPCGCRPPTVVEGNPRKPTMAPPDEDYEHWPDNAKLQAVKVAPAAGYDNHNGLHEHTYFPAGAEVKKAKKKDSPKAAPAPSPVPQQQAYPQYMRMPGPYVPYMQYPQPMYYGYGAVPPAYTPEPVDEKIDPEPEKKPSPKPKAKSPRRWQGRTKAEVEEDDMKIAAAEGANREFKLRPSGMEDTQIVWVVALDGSTSLRTAREVGEMEGEWKIDPRFNSSYFVQAADEEEGEKGKK